MPVVKWEKGFFDIGDGKGDWFGIGVGNDVGN
jgi:hypothetical protein